MDKNGSNNKEKIFTATIDLKDFFKMYIPTFFHPYLYSNEAKIDFSIIPLEELDKKISKKQDHTSEEQLVIVDVMLTHQKLQSSLVVTKVSSMNKNLAKIFTAMPKHSPTSNTSSRRDNSSSSSSLPAYLSGTEEKQSLSISSTKASTFDTSQLVTTETTPRQSTQLESISEEVTSSTSPVVCPKASLTNPKGKEKQRERKKNLKSHHRQHIKKKFQ